MSFRVTALTDIKRIQVSLGRLAQLVERLPYKEDVGGSSPSAPTTF